LVALFLSRCTIRDEQGHQGKKDDFSHFQSFRQVIFKIYVFTDLKIVKLKEKNTLIL
jgi:hypothetical protein